MKKSLSVVMLLTIIKPFDAHLHLREGEMAYFVTPISANVFSDVIPMPNLKKPIRTVPMAIDYRSSLISYAACNYHMTIYLTESTTVEDVREVANNPFVLGFKLYPVNATTGSQNGISDIKKIYPLLKEMERLEVPLLVHGEVTRPDVDIFDREKVFIDEVLTDIVKTFPELRITLEHITTEYAVNFVLKTKNVVATITAQHLLKNRNAIFTVGKNTALNPHNFCLPVLKTERDRLALLKAATSGNPKFFAGTDSAPHPLSCKESSCGCAGCFTALTAVELYTTAFDQVGKLEYLENFLSVFGRNYYGIPIPSETIDIKREKQVIPERLDFAGLTPFMHGEEIDWIVYTK